MIMLTIFHFSLTNLNLYEIGYSLLPVSNICFTSIVLTSISMSVLFGNSVEIVESPH